MGMTIILTMFVVALQMPHIRASAGDQSPIYQSCLRTCANYNCTENGSFNPHAAEMQEYACQIMLWDCMDECKYICMWKTVDTYTMKGLAVPKFHGKWPFIRWLGMQEPAAAVASLLNCLAHNLMFSQMWNHKFTVRMSKFWLAFVLLCIHAWGWSMVFHCRDTLFTELMDYLCAMSMIVALLFAAIYRVLYRYPGASLVIAFPVLVFFLEYTTSLEKGKIDYSYNMKANVILGVAAFGLWLGWSLLQVSKGRRYAMRMITFTFISAAALSLELFDFPPIFAILDAHALWHFVTAPLPLLFYRFVIDDLKFLSKNELERIIILDFKVE